MMRLPIKTTAVDFDKIGFKNTATEVHKSDFLRLYLLTTFGGVWSDMDIIYFKSITNLSVNVIENQNKETFVCSSAYGHSIGFLMSQPGSKFFQYLLDTIKSRPMPSQYQAIGPTLYNENFRNIETINLLSPAINLDMDVVYSHNAGSIPDFLNNVSPRFTNGSIGSHWYAGHSQWSDFIKTTNGGLINLSNNLIGNIIRKVNEE
jgi:mannosyltransferase OCH1-like enzyme